MKSVLLICFYLILNSVLPAPGVTSAVLIVPGHSIGKITLGDTPAKVHARMGKPHATLTDKAICYQDGKKKLERKVTIDVWLRPKATGSLQVIYDSGRVAQVQVSLPGYRIRRGMAIGSTIQAFDRMYKNADIISFGFGEDEHQFGFDHWITQQWDYIAQGATLLSNTFYTTDDPAKVCVNSIMVHKRHHSAFVITTKYN